MVGALIVGITSLLISCNQPTETKNAQPAPVDSNAVDTTSAPVQPRPLIQRRAPDSAISFRMVSRKKWMAANDSLLRDSMNYRKLLAVNRIDSSFILQKDSILVPSDFSAGYEFYFPFPLSVPAVREIKKIIFFSYPTQSFGAYENGDLVYAGPTNMGRRKDLTPSGLFYTNWKAEETKSTFNDEWQLRWNFNIENKLGIGWHQYAMPGYPASHSCLRLLEWDARYLYDWADQWILDKNENVVAKGTPVIVYGEYNFKGRRPWLALAKDSLALAIRPGQLDSLVTPVLPEIKNAQMIREQRLQQADKAKGGKADSLK